MDSSEDNNNDVFQSPAEQPQQAPRRIAYHVYKIGDLGLATQLSDAHVEEGDCRYLPKVGLVDDC